jgi:hypothetical protein
VTHNQVGPESINALEARIRVKQQEELGRRRSVEVQTVLKQTKAATNLKNLGFM